MVTKTVYGKEGKMAILKSKSFWLVDHMAKARGLPRRLFNFQDQKYKDPLEGQVW